MTEVGTRTTKDAPDSGRKLSLQLFVGFFLLTVLACLALRPDKKPLLADNEFQFFGAERVASGVPPYRSFITPKTAASFLLTGGAIALGREFDVPDVIAARAASILVFAFGVGMLTLLTLELIGNPWLAGLGGLTMLTFSGLVDHAVIGSRPKIFLVAFMCWALWAIARRAPVAHGVAVALVALTWQPAALAMLPGTLSFLWAAENRRRTFVRIALGGLACLVVYELYFSWFGLIGDSFYYSVYVPLFLMPKGHETLALTIASFQVLWPQAFGGHQPATYAFPVVTLVGAWGLLRRLFAGGRDRHRTALGLALVAGALISVAFTAYDRQGAPDFFLIAPYLALSVPIGMSWFGKLWAPRWRRSLPIAACVVMVAFGIRQRAHYEQFLDRKYDLASQIDLAHRLQDRVGPNATVYAHGCAHLLAFLHRDNWSPWVLMFRGWKQIAAHDPAHAPTLVGPGRHALPDVVLNDRWGHPPQLQEVLQSKYRKVGGSRFKRQHIDIWVRKTVGEKGGRSRRDP